MPTSEQRARGGVCVVGAAGRMGQRVIRLLRRHGSLTLRAALERAATSTVAGTDAGVLAGGGPMGVEICTDPTRALAQADVVVDFSAPAAAVELAPLCAERGVPYLIASTALTPADVQAVEAAAQRCAVLEAANLSTGVNVLLELVELAARRLGLAFDVEVSEIHHRHKRDAPSGTALALGAAARRGRGELRDVMRRAGTSDPRDASELGYVALRGGDVAGEHTVFFLGDGERIELTHRSASADIFAAGAVRAAAWLIGRPAGRYTMRDVLLEA